MMKQLKQFIFVVLIVGQMGFLSPFEARGEEGYIRPATLEEIERNLEEEIERNLTEKAKKEVIDLAESYSKRHIELVQMGEEFEKLLKKWKLSQVSPQVLISTWNSYFIAAARVVVSRYQADLWRNSGGQSNPSKDNEIFESYSLILKKIGFSPKLLELHGRDSKTFEEASKVFQFLKERKDFILSIGGKVGEDGFDLSGVDFFALTDAQLEKWDLYLGKHQLPEGEEISQNDFRRRLKSLLEDHHTFLQSHLKHVEDRGLWQMLEGIYRGDKEDPNGVEIQGAYKLISATRRKMERLGIPSILIADLLEKEKAYGKYVGQLFEEDIQQVKWARIGVALAPLVPVGMAGGTVLGLSANTSAILAGVPLAISGVKGIGSFVIQGLFDNDHFRGDQLFNDLMPGLTAALPFSAALPLFAGGITAIASLDAVASASVAIKGVTITGSQALVHGTFYTLIGYGLASGLHSAAEGTNEVSQGDKRGGTLLIWDGSVDIAASLLFLKFARTQAVKSQSVRPGQREEGGGESAAESTDVEPAEPLLRSRTFWETKEFHPLGGRPKGATDTESGTATALLEESVPLRKLLEFETPQTLPPDDVLFSGPMPRELPRSPSPQPIDSLPNVLPVWTGAPIEDEGMEEVWIRKDDENGKPISLRKVRVKKGSTEREIWEQVGAHDAYEYIVGATDTNRTLENNFYNGVLSSEDGIVSGGGGAQGDEDEDSDGEKDSQKSLPDVSFFSMVSISNIQSIKDLFPRDRTPYEDVSIISLGSGKVGLWERKLEERFKVKVTPFDRNMSQYLKHRTQGDAIEGDFFDYKPKTQYDMAIFNSPRFSSGSRESPDNFKMMAEVLDKFLKPGGIGIILTEFTDQISNQGSQTPVQDLLRIFGEENVTHLKALEGYDLGSEFFLASLHLGGEFFMVKKPLFDHPDAMVFHHFERESKIHWGWNLKSNGEALFEKSESSLFRREIEFWLSMVLGNGWEKNEEYKNNPIHALIYIAVESDRAQMSWNEDIYKEAILYLIQATRGRISWVTDKEKDEIWDQLAILDERDIHQIVEYLLKNTFSEDENFICGRTFLQRLEDLAILLREAWKTNLRDDESLQVHLASLYAVLISKGRDMIGRAPFRILDDIPDLLDGEVTKVEEVCSAALYCYLLYGAKPERKMEAELMLYDLLSRHELNEDKKGLVQELKEKMDAYWTIRRVMTKNSPNFGISFFVERMIDPRVPYAIRVKARQFLETIAADPDLFGKVILSLMPYFELGDRGELNPAAKLQVQIFFHQAKDKVKPFLERLRDKCVDDKDQRLEAIEGDENVILIVINKILIDKILKFIDEGETRSK